MHLTDRFVLDMIMSYLRTQEMVRKKKVKESGSYIFPFVYCSAFWQYAVNSNKLPGPSQYLLKNTVTTKSEQAFGLISSFTITAQPHLLTQPLHTSGEQAGGTLQQNRHLLQSSPLQTQ